MDTKVTYWVMYNETYRLQAGGEETRDTQHYGTSDLEAAKKTVREFRDLASQGRHFLTRSSGCINSAWIEIERRSVYPY